MNFRFYLNDTLVEEPNNWQQFTETLVRDETKRHVFFDYPISLEFIGEAYDLLDGVYQDNYDSKTQFKVIQVFDDGEELLFEAFIKTSNITFDLIREVAIAEIDDAVYQTYIFNNYSVEVGCGAETSKNGADIDSIPFIDLRLFNPVTGVYFVESYRAFDVKDAMKMLVDYVSDGTIDFQSSWYDNLPNNEKYCILTGIEMRENTGRTAPIVSLESLFNELWKKYNLYLIVENPIQEPTIRLEEEAYLYGDTTFEILNAENLTRSIDFERLYSTISLGSNTNIRERGATFLFPYLRLFSFCDETFNVESEINVDNELDLISDFIIDTNVIQDVLVNNDESYDEEIFLVQYEQGVANRAVAGDYFDTVSPDSRLYNEQLLNANVAERFSVLGNLVLETGAVQSGFKATQNQGLTFVVDLASIGDTEIVFPEQVWQFQNDSTGDNFDIGDDYNPATGEFTADETGEHAFRHVFRINTFGNLSQPPGRPGFDVNLSSRISRNNDAQLPSSYLITRFYADSSVETLTIAPSDSFTIPLGVEVTTIEVVQVRNLVPFDTVAVRASMSVTSTGALTFTMGVNASTFELIASPLAGGVYSFKDPDDYYIGILEAKSILLAAGEWDGLRTDITKLIAITDRMDLPRKGYAKKISRNFTTGEADIMTVFNRKQSTI
jgi:hypothetical protein